MPIDDQYQDRLENPDLAEDITRLYVTRIERDDDEPVSAFFQTQDGPQRFLLYGEMVVEAEQNDARIFIPMIRRLALYGSAGDRPMHEDDAYGVVSIVGSSLPSKPNEPLGRQDFQFRATLHYRALSTTPAYRIYDAEFPTLEEIEVTVTLSDPEFNERMIQLSVQIKADLIGEPIRGLISNVADPTVAAIIVPIIRRTFTRGGTGEPRGKPAHSLQSHCLPPSPPAGVPCTQTVSRWLPVKFVNLTPETVANLEPICQNLLDRVCQVWRDQAALDLTVVGLIQDAVQLDKNRFSILTPAKEKALETCAYASVTHIELYICTELDSNYNGGFTYACGQAASYCLLDLDMLQQDSTLAYLLAHELGHAMGLDHPGPTALAGSPGSIMAGANDPNKHKNTLPNCRVFSMPTEVALANGTRQQTFVALNPIVHTTAIPDCFRPLP